MRQGWKDSLATVVAVGRKRLLILAAAIHTNAAKTKTILYG